MAEQALIQFRVDKDLKQEVADICDALGTDMPTVFRMCMKQIKIVRGIPFSTKLPETVVTRSEAMNAFDQLRQEAAATPEMSLDEINEEIAAARAERKARKAAVV
ncbi:MAG: type II toxin-antitoxin system RelB/DinJ family antitoxin [Clostridium sp.]|nr:type II toxin-antitoxin system RelB/DinJ family antitoxin [Clostridia bacterium]MBO6268962.1 type II toxin-antitoxin system RelB/DinJ family antitoxin [Clostridium sp.]MBP3927374.1 type II toxin-antitoxin system RelB/DinJ family antitoxin [Clostridium sp.]MBQ9032841.1 type II toxin-antitoxin system RelB/DinJ family antitoxin [Parasporobacterium sp.]